MPISIGVKQLFNNGHINNRPVLIQILLPIYIIFNISKWYLKSFKTVCYSFISIKLNELIVYEIYTLYLLSNWNYNWIHIVYDIYPPLISIVYTVFSS